MYILKAILAALLTTDCLSVEGSCGFGCALGGVFFLWGSGGNWGKTTHDIPLLFLFIEQFTRLAHGHADERILPPSSSLSLLMMLLPLIPTTTEHLERLHGGARAHAFAVMLLLSSLSSPSATVHLLMSLHGALLVEVFVGVGLFVAA